MMMTARDERGFTLIEAVISVAILGIVMAALATAMILYFRTTDATTQKLSESPGLQLAASYFASDAQSNDIALGSQDCLGAGQASALVSFRWQDPGVNANFTTDDRNVVVSYLVVQVGTQKQLWRNRCEGALNTDGTRSNEIGTLSSTHLVKFIDPMTNPAATTSGPQTKVEMVLCTSTGSTCRDEQVRFSLNGTRRKP